MVSETEALPSWVPSHIEVLAGGPERYAINCSACGMGMQTQPPTYDKEFAANLAASFLVQHAVHKGSRPTGLTPGGKPSTAFRRYVNNREGQT